MYHSRGVGVIRDIFLLQMYGWGSRETVVCLHHIYLTNISPRSSTSNTCLLAYALGCYRKFFKDWPNLTFLSQFLYGSYCSCYSFSLLHLENAKSVEKVEKCIRSHKNALLHLKVREWKSCLCMWICTAIAKLKCVPTSKC